MNELSNVECLGLNETACVFRLWCECVELDVSINFARTLRRLPRVIEWSEGKGSGEFETVHLKFEGTKVEKRSVTKRERQDIVQLQAKSTTIGYYSFHLLSRNRSTSTRQILMLISLAAARGFARVAARRWSSRCVARVRALGVHDVKHLLLPRLVNRVENGLRRR